MYDGRLAARTRPRRSMFVLFAAALATIILFSRHPLFAEPTEASLGLDLPSPPQNAPLLDLPNPPQDTPFLHSPPPPQNIPLEPVVFALIVFSENSAKEGAILLKVPSYLNRSRCPANEENST